MAPWLLILTLSILLASKHCTVQGDSEEFKMSIFFKHLSTLGLVILLGLALLGFILECFAATSSWNLVTLSSCVQSATTVAIKNVKLYLQPNNGICYVATVGASSSFCVSLFSDATFWTTWDSLTGNIGENGASGAGAIAAGKLPQVYSLTVASIFFSLFILMTVGFHFYKPETLSRFMTQLISGMFSLVICIFMIYTPTYAGTNVLSSGSDWKTFYAASPTLEIACAKESSTQYIGGGCALMSFVCSLGVLFLSVFPTCFGTCFYFVEEGGGSGGESSSSGASDIKSSLVDNDASNSSYVPPVV